VNLVQATLRHTLNLGWRNTPLYETMALSNWLVGYRLLVERSVALELHRRWQGLPLLPELVNSVTTCAGSVCLDLDRRSLS
jgi:hypothetical protein